MNFQDLVSYTATQVTGSTFSLSLVSGFVDMPAGVERVVYIKDDANKYCVVDASRSAGTLTVLRVRESSESNGAVPTFGNNIQIYSNISAKMYGQNFKGKGAILCIGQSNHIGWDSAANTTTVDYAVDAVTQNRHQTLDSSSVPTSTAEDGPQKAAQPLWWYTASTGPQIGSPVIHMANALHWYEGHKAIEIQPGARDGSGYSSGHWNKTQPAYENLVAMTVEFLNRDPDNYIICMVDIGGENDTAAGGQATYENNFDTMYTNLRADIQAATGYDMTTTPLIVAGMNDYMAVYGAAYTAIEAIRADTPNRIPFSAFIDMTGQPNVDTFGHHTIAGYRYMGREAFLPAYRQALANYPAAETITNVTGTLAETLSIVSASISGTNTAPAGVVDGSLAETMDSASLAASGTVAAAPASETPLTDAIGVDVQLRKDRGITADGSNKVSQWDDYSGNNNHAIETPSVTTKPTVNGSGQIVFDASLKEALMLSGFNLNDVNGFTVIVRMTVDATNAGTLFGDDRNYAYWTTSTTQLKTIGDTSVSVAEDNTGSEVILEWWTDGTNASFDVGGVSKVSNQALTTGGTNSADFFFGCFNNFLYYSDLTLSDVVIKKGAPLSESQRNQIISEFIA